MNIEVKNILPMLKELVYTLRSYVVLIFIICFVLIYSFLVFKVGTISSTDPDEDIVAKQLKGTQKLRVDQDAIDKIEQLKDQNIAVQSLFETARDNPFQD